MGQDARWRPAGAPAKGENPGQDPKVQEAVAKIKEQNARRK